MRMFRNTGQLLKWLRRKKPMNYKNWKTSDLQWQVNNNFSRGRIYRKMKRELQRRLGYSDLDRVIENSNSILWQTICSGVIAALLLLSLYMSQHPLAAYFWYRLITTVIMGLTALGIFLGVILLFTGLLYNQRREEENE